MKPIIGITCSLWAQKEKWVHQEGRTFDHLKREYYQRVEACGGLPMLLPNVDRDETLDGLLTRIDGLLLSGGDDIDPACYDEPRLFEPSIIHPHRDRVEIELARRARELGRPVFGICRGIQLINVAFGGSLYQDTSLRPGTSPHNSGQPYIPVHHEVIIAKGTRLHNLAGRERVTVTSTHHQHLKRVAEGFTVSATAPDGVVEAIERVSGNEHLIAVQWHPESLPDEIFSRALFEDFIEAARE